MSTRRATVDVSELTLVPFGHRSLLWWGTVGFMLIEGFTLLLMTAAYLYLRQSEFEWPPGRTPNPDLLVPTLNTVLLLLVMVPLYFAKKAAMRMDRAGVVRMLAIGTLMSAAAAVLRWWELLALQVRWDAHAYASAAWGLVVLHATLVLVDVFETGTLCGLFLTGKAKRKHYPDVADAADYQYFLSLAWLPVYFVAYWGPRVL